MHERNVWIDLINLDNDNRLNLDNDNRLKKNSIFLDIWRESYISLLNPFTDPLSSFDA